MTNKEAIKYLKQLYPNGGHCWLDEQRMEAIGMAVKALQEEPISEEQVKEDTMTIRKEWFEHCKKSWYNEGYIDGEYNRDRQFEKPVSEDFEEALAKEWKGYNDRGAATVDALEDNTQELAFAKGFYRGAKWQEERLWKPADGDDLPEIGREVVAFQEAFPTDVDVPSLLKVVIAHRPNPKGYDGKSIATGKVEHYTPKTYDKGGWNIPDVVLWLDLDIPQL